MQALLSAATHYNSEKGGFGSFAAVCIANCMKNTVSNAKRRASKLADEEELVSVADSAPSPEEVVIRRETSEELYKLVLSELTPLEKACLDGVIFGLSYEEIAGKIGAEKKTVDNAVTRARAKLRKYHSYFTE
jgi:RNA polymerase sigma factor (sigma-70 family)